ncbi:MAG: hypothetical protein PHH59_01120 [Methylovulum sp.]|uniref:hypothetical protein n=1 Tax=Methylovulum sp. TaxID=1916980 RepID=UPI002618CADE|nr:hypothetical protein [Methylovulum sp.]MDD2722608.1 hypothetical protein [Methylovulum sp.]MDD5123794.1 hypothetical protein [Methylovulum sp.]
MSNKFFNILAGFLLLLASGNLFATQVDRVTLDEAIRDAGLIFQGTVTKIESHTLAELGTNYEPMRFAFVTFRVERVIKGQIEGDGTTLTLPFHSCLVLDYKRQKSMMEQEPTLSPTDALMKMQPAMTEELGVGMACEITGMSHFIGGESDILFVDKEAGSNPLVGWGQGRYSIVNNKIYPVAWLTQEGGIDFTSPYGLKDEQEAEKLGQMLPQEAQKHGWTPPKGAKRMEPDEFSEVIERKLHDLEQTQFMAGKPSVEPVKSADIRDPIYRRIAEWKYKEAQKYKVRALEKLPNTIQQGE